MKRSNYFF